MIDKTGTQLIDFERAEQLGKHGRTVEEDVIQNSDGQLIEGAYRLISIENYLQEELKLFCPDGWNLELWFKMCKKSYRERLIIAGALIAAEIDRLDFVNEQR